MGQQTRFFRLLLPVHNAGCTTIIRGSAGDVERWALELRECAPPSTEVAIIDLAEHSSWFEVAESVLQQFGIRAPVLNPPVWTEVLIKFMSVYPRALVLVVLNADAWFSGELRSLGDSQQNLAYSLGEVAASSVGGYSNGWIDLSSSEVVVLIQSADGSSRRAFDGIVGARVAEASIAPDTTAQLSPRRPPRSALEWLWYHAASAQPYLALVEWMRERSPLAYDVGYSGGVFRRLSESSWVGRQQRCARVIDVSWDCRSNDECCASLVAALARLSARSPAESPDGARDLIVAQVPDTGGCRCFETAFGVAALEALLDRYWVYLSFLSAPAAKRFAQTHQSMRFEPARLPGDAWIDRRLRTPMFRYEDVRLNKSERSER